MVKKNNPNRAVQLFFGIGVAVLVYVVVLLGVQAFYHEVTWDDYNCTYPMAKDINVDLQGCTTNMTVGQCIDYRESHNISAAEQAKYDECNDKFNADQKVYNKNMFLITAIVGALIIIFATLLISLVNISVGVSFAGLVLIVYGFIRGWTSTGDVLKFVVALVIAALVIWLGVRMSSKKK